MIFIFLGFYKKMEVPTEIFYMNNYTVFNPEDKTIICKDKVLRRRDRPNIIKKYYSEHITFILQNKSLSDCVNLLFRQVNELYKGNIDIQGLSTTKRCLNYKTQTHPMKLLMKRYPYLQPGYVVQYLVMNNGCELRGKRMYLIDDPQVNSLSLDSSHYIQLLFYSVVKLLQGAFNMQSVELLNSVYQCGVTDSTYKKFMECYILNKND